MKEAKAQYDNLVLELRQLWKTNPMQLNLNLDPGGKPPEPEDEP